LKKIKELEAGADEITELGTPEPHLIFKAYRRER